MTEMPRFVPRPIDSASFPRVRRVVVLVFEDFQLLDAAGPIAAFETANELCPGAYQIQVRARAAGAVRSSSGVEWLAQAFGTIRAVHTLIAVGGNGTRAAALCPNTRRFILRAAEAGARICSVCSGTYLLAAAGLLDGKPATTHWCRSQDFAERFPKVKLDADRIYVKAGRTWTSAGVSAGLDLALALITEDLGEATARRVAQQLVVYYRRPGGQSQFSSLLELERGDGRFQGLLDHIRANLRADLSVPHLARQVAMSPRNFSRLFSAETGMSPAKAVERIRTEVARAALDSGRASVQEVAERCGFGDRERMRRSFIRLYGVSPGALRARSK